MGTVRGRPSGPIVARTARRAASMKARWLAVRKGSDGIAAYDGPMSRIRRPPRGIGIRAALLATIAVLLVGCSPNGASSPTASGDTSSAAPGSSATTAPDATPSASAPSSPGHPLNVPPLASGSAIKAYAAFLSRVNDDRATVDGLDRDLSNASSAADLDAVRVAAVAILDFVDGEREWLLGHPPAGCYADAHASALAMLVAYGGAADRFVDWSTSGGGLGGLPALGRAAEAADTAKTALTTFASVLGGATCQS